MPIRNVSIAVSLLPGCDIEGSLAILNHDLFLVAPLQQENERPLIAQVFFRH